MKNHFIIGMLLILSSCSLYAQSREPAQKPLRYLPNQQLSYFSSSDSNFKRPKSVIIGFHWCNDASIAKAIFANQNNVFDRQLFNNNKASLNQAQNNANLIVQNDMFLNSLGLI